MKLSNKLKVSLLLILCMSASLAISFKYLDATASAEGNVNAEIEDNDLMSTATRISLNTEYIGSIQDKNPDMYNAGELDYFCFDVTDDGYFFIDFGPSSIDSTDVGSGWNISIYNGTSCIYSNRKIKTTTATPNIPLAKGSTVYILITAANTYYSSCPTDILYKVQVNFMKSVVWEKEDNDQRSTANQIKVNNAYYGNLIDKNPDDYNSGESDFFTTIIDKTGYFNISFFPANIDDLDKIKSGWVLNVYDGTTKIYECNAKGLSITTPNFPLKKGSIIYIEITEKSSYYSNCPTLIDYCFIVNFNKAENWEIEDNDERSTANQIKVNNAYYGNLFDKNSSDYYSGEFDYYKTKLTADGYFNISLTPASIDWTNVGKGWNVEIYNNTSLIYSANGIELTTHNISLKKNSTIYIKISAANDYYTNCPTNVDYMFTVNFSKTKYWESENNDKKSEAKIITDVNKKYYGNISDKDSGDYRIGEDDYYKYTATKNGTLSIGLGVANSDNLSKLKDGWKLDIIINNKVKFSTNYIADTLKTLKSLKVKKGDIIYIKIAPTDTYYADCPVYIDYLLYVKFK